MTPAMPDPGKILPSVSVIIPTYNRKYSLLCTLESLTRQTYPAERFEVVVVDDGGSDSTEEVAGRGFPFVLRYVRQENQGDAAARNRGAQEAQGEILQFLDDDIVIVPDFLSIIVHDHLWSNSLIVVGRLVTVPASSPTIFEQVTADTQHGHDLIPGELDFTEVQSGVLSLRREHYFTLGMMQPLAHTGSSVWCDVEFAYRAYLHGFAFWRSANAIGYHDDYALRDLHISCQRVKRAASAGADLFRRHPDLKSHIPMFYDKEPIVWRQDPPRLIAHKLTRQVISSPPALRSMESLVRLLEACHPAPVILARLYRWIGSGYIYQGYRAGLKEIEAQGI